MLVVQRVVETEANGSPMISKSCVRCSPGTYPSNNRTKCLPCPIENCTCPSNSHELLFDGSLCVFRQNLTLWPDDVETHLVEYDIIGVEVESDYLKKYLRALLYKCVKVNTKFHSGFMNYTVFVTIYRVFVLWIIGKT